MMNANTVPLSEIIRMKSTEETEDVPKTRDDWKKAKELDEARKAGTAPAAVDEEGRDINPHIPQYISAAPWYYSTRGPTLKHQRQQEQDKKVYSGLDEWYQRGVDSSKVATKFRKGACENCGAMSHKRKDCMERPRKIGARFSGQEIAPDEPKQPDLALDFDGKRDRWNGYDPNDYVAVVDEFQKVEEAKRHLKAFKIRSGAGTELPDNMVEDVEGPEDDEDKYVDDVDMPGTKVDSKQRITVRNLRIREDTAKYLRNLDPNSAYYDPKTRAMRDNPYKDTKNDPENVHYAGENFVRYTGDTNRHAQAQLFAWEAVGKGVDVHLLAEPTKLEVLQKEFEKKKDEFKGSLTRNIIDQYGGEEHLSVPPKALLLAQTEDYVEYSRQGKIIKGGEKPVVRSKYDEDIHPTNHTSVFGSYWRDGQWGYHCCHSLILNSYCAGGTGRAVNDNISISEVIQDKDLSQEAAKESAPPKSLVELHRENLSKAAEAAAAAAAEKTKSKKNQKKKQKKRERKKVKAGQQAAKKKKDSSESSQSSSSSSSDSDSSDDDEEAKKKKELKKALAEEERRQAAAELMSDDRKRAYNSRYDEKALTEAEIEAYHMKRKREEDPMLEFLSRKSKK